MARELQTAKDVIDALGGNAATARLTGRKAQHIYNWKAADRLPADTFLQISKALAERNATARPELWSIKPADAEVS